MGSLEESKALAEFEGLIAWWALKFQHSLPFEFEDLKQEGRLAFIEAFRTYNPEKSELATYAGTVIKTRFLHMIRDSRRVMRDAPLVSMDEVVRGDDTARERGRSRHDILGEEDPRFENMHRRQLHAFVKREMEKLPFRTQQMMEMRSREESLEDIGKRFDVGRERVRQIVEKGEEQTRRRVEAVIR